MTLQEKDDTIILDLVIRRPPESVKRWWTDLPEDYTATDPREQPYHIVTVGRTEKGRDLLCTWRAPDGTERQTQETLQMKGDNEWSFDVHAAGFHILDEFRAVPTEGGTRLEIRSKLTRLSSATESIILAQKQRMMQGWKTTVEICERDAP